MTIDWQEFAPLLAGVVAVATIGLLISEQLHSVDRRMKKRLLDSFLTSPSELPERSALFKDLNLLHAETLGAEAGIWQRFEELVEQSAVATTPRALIGWSIGGLLFGAAVGLAATGNGFVGLLGAAGLGTVPLLYVLNRRQSRLRVFCSQLPSTFDLMSRAVKAGQTISAALQTVAMQSKPPLSIEFARCCEQQNLGLPPAIALGELARRTGVIELQFFVVALLVQRQAGGSPVEILSSLSDMVRKRIRLRERVRALTGEGRMQAVVLSLLPLVALVALYVLNRPYAEVLLQRPRLLGGLLASQLAGAWWIRRIVTFEY